MSNKSGELVFDQHFSKIYAERWPQIKKALLQDDCKVARRNLFAKEDIESPVAGVGEALESPPHCFKIAENFDLTSLDRTLLPFYRMDPASIYPALALEVQPGDQVLDMCAAPGGKTLVLLEQLTNAERSGDFDLSGRLDANELSAKRRHRMMSVFKRHLPKEVRSLVNIRGVDGSRIGLSQKDHFDRILLDAPCSGERGVLHKASDLALWKPKRPKGFAIRQYALLSSAFMALKPGGRIVYSTCSISPEENDGVIEKLLKRKKDQVRLVKDYNPGAMADITSCGFQFLPDKMGWGPIYFSIVEKA